MFSITATLLKLFGFFAAVITAVLLALNITNTWDPGTLALTRPDAAPCQSYAKNHLEDREPHLIEVRWIMTAENYGWGCFFEYDISDTFTVTPMPDRAGNPVGTTTPPPTARPFG